MDAFVAPTVIDIINPTFWLSDSKDQTDSFYSENLLKKIFETNSFKMEFEITFKEFLTINVPKIGIYLHLGNVSGSFSPKTFKYFISVLQGILFDTGEKTSE